MAKNLIISEQRIINCLSADYGINIDTLALLPLGADMNASVYKAKTHDGSSYFVKLKFGNQLNVSATMISLLQDSGITQVIPIIKTTCGKIVQHIDDYSLTVSPFINGKDGFRLDLTEEQWINLGKLVKQVHQIRVPPSIQAMLRQELYSSKWRDNVKSFYAVIDSEINGDEVTLKLQEFMKDHMLEIHRLVDRAEKLSEQIQKCLPDLVLCHSDLHGGNILIDENNLIYIVDWDDPILAPKERDLMFIGGGVANVWNKKHEEVLFYKGYGNTEINMAIMAYYRHERIVEDIAIYGQALLLSTVGGQNRQEFYNQFVAQFEPNGVVEIAFKTDEKLSVKTNLNRTD